MPAFATMFEKIISAQHGTTISYDEKNLFNLGLGYESQEINQIHSGALSFANNIKAYIKILKK